MPINPTLISGRSLLPYAPKITTTLVTVALSAMANSVYAEESITGVLTDFGGFYESYEGNVSPIELDSANNLLGFQQNGTTFSTGVNDQRLTENDITFTSATFKALVPFEFTSALVGQGSLDDGNASDGTDLLFPIENRDITAYLTDGTNGLGFSTFGNNVASTTNFNLSNININALDDDVPEFMYYNNAAPSASAVEFKLFNSADEQIGITASSAENSHPSIATVSNDRFRTTSPFQNVHANQIISVQGFTLSLADFGIDATQLSSAVRLEVNLPPAADPPFIAYNSDSLTACAIGDQDNDRVCDLVEGDADSDSDGLSDKEDTDSDGDSIPDIFEGTGDTDGDTIPDYLDTDSDGDGILDSEEDTTMPDASGVDTDSDGIDDVFDADQTGGFDNNGNGFDDALEPTDTDGDGINNHLDSDSDNDGISDSVEGNDDADNDTVPNYVDTDSDGDGISDSDESGADTDSDNTPNYLDTDSDNDGIDDSEEADGDADGDGTPDYLDDDSDNDGISNTIEGGNETDTDNDGLPDFLDRDSDNDGIPDILEGSIDSDSDGIADFRDGDGVIDERDPDADGDGFSDFQSNGSGSPNLSELPDSNGNGIADINEPGVGFTGNAGRIRTGLSGSGCSISSSVSSTEPLDPLLPLLGFTALMLALRQRAKHTVYLLATATLSLVTLGTITNPAMAADEPVPSAEAVNVNDPSVDVQPGFKQHFYTGFGVGVSRLEPDSSEVSSVDAEDNNEAAAQLTVGWDANRWLSLEVHIAELGDADLSNGSSISYRTFGASGLFYVSKNRKRFKRQGLNAYGRLGFGHLDNDESDSSVQFSRDNTNHAIFGAGVEYAGKKGLSLRAEVISFDTDVRYVQLAAVFRIGERQ